MKRLPLLSSVLALSLALSHPAALAHVGHGDEFQAEGGVDRVEVNAETDPLLGIQVNPVESATDGSGAVMIPVSALVDDGDRQLVFVQYENFYEPVPVTTGATEGEMIEILEGLSVGEQLVTQGSLSLYAESRKSQTAEAEPEAAETTTSAAPAEEAPVTEAPETETTEVEASDVAEEPVETAEASSRYQLGLVAAIVVGAAIVLGANVVLGKGKKENV